MTESMAAEALAGDAPTKGRPPNSLYFAVGELNGKVDQILNIVVPQLIPLDARITAVEVFQNRLMGAIVVVTFLIGALEFLRYVHVLP